MTKETPNPNDELDDEASFWMDDASSGYVLKETAEAPVYDLEERTSQFGGNIIRFAKALPETAVTRPLVNQLVRAGTSVGANYCEADNAVSKKEFRLKIAICQKEAREAKHWLRMIAVAAPEAIDAARALWREARELHLIFSAILRRS